MALKKKHRADLDKIYVGVGEKNKIWWGGDKIKITIKITDIQSAVTKVNDAIYGKGP